MFCIRAIQFLLMGQNEFTHQAFITNSKEFNEKDLQVDLYGQHIIITGANSGIGYHAALQLIRKGAFIHLLCRNKNRGQEALKKLKVEAQKLTEQNTEQIAQNEITISKMKQEDNLINNSQKINNNYQNNCSLHLVDMADLDSIKDFVNEFLALKVPLNGLVHNAGCMYHEKMVTQYNLEYNFTANLAGPYFMTELFMPLLHKTFKKTKQAKVILVASGGQYTQPLRYDDFNMDKIKNFDGRDMYAVNKRQQVVLCEKWTDVYTQKTGVQFFSMHPGWVDTPVLPTAMPGFYQHYKEVLRKCPEGSDTIQWLICMNSEKLISGEFYFDRKAQSKHLKCCAYTQHNKKEVDLFYENLKKALKCVM